MIKIYKAGILGGSFDPVHLGHIGLALDARKNADLHEVVFVPARIQPFKQDRKVTSGEDRLAMLRLALSQYDELTVSSTELDHEGVSYTYLTLRRLQEFYDDVASRKGYDMAKLYFITGTDSLLKLDTWMNATELLHKYSYIVGSRPGYLQEELEEMMEYLLDEYGTEIINLPQMQMDVSSTEIRRRIADGQPLTGRVPESVERYIAEHGLYHTA